MQINDFEKAIIDKLKDNITDVAIEAYPDNPDTYKLIHPKGAILVHYSGSKFMPSLYDEVIIQQRKLTYDIIILAKSLRGNGSIYETMDKVRETLTGFKYQDAIKMYPIDEEYIHQENGLWQYGMRFESRVKHIEKEYEY